MATFIGTVQGNHGKAHRLGHTHINAVINGWDIGVRVEGKRDDKGFVFFTVYRTGGTHKNKIDTVIAEVK